MKLILDQIEKHFGEKQVLKGASFTFEQGHIYGLLGRNGEGKTTLMNCLSGEFPPDGGTFHLEAEGAPPTPGGGGRGLCPLHPRGARIPDWVGVREILSGDCRG